MLPTVHISLFGWPIVVVALFMVLKPRRAVIASFLFAWLFLPMAGFEFSGLPNWTKMTATGYGVLLGVVLFDAGRLVNFRPSWIDIPIVVWCLSPMVSSVVNGLGAYDGASVIVNQIATWGIPYFIGRMYFNDLEGLQELALGIFIGGLIYMPLCLWEIRMSPRLHQTFYGFRQHSWRQHLRGDGYRPMVFMQHGLAVAMWMSVATLSGFWLWWTGAVRKLRNIPMVYLVTPLFGTLVLCKSIGALALLVLGCAVLLATKYTRSGVFILCILVLPLMYMGVRATGIWDGSHLVDLSRAVTNEDRAGSLQYRITAENILAEHALREPIFGWGGHGRNRPARMGYDVENLATDGLWIITLGSRGLVGLAALTALILLPVFLLWRKLPSRGWGHPATAAPAALAMILVLFMLDNLLNAMLNPIYLLAAAGLSGWLTMGLQTRRRVARSGHRVASQRDCPPIREPLVQ